MNEKDRLDAEWKAHVMRMLAYLAIRAAEPNWRPPTDVLTLTRKAEDIALAYDKDAKP